MKKWQFIENIIIADSINSAIRTRKKDAPVYKKKPTESDSKKVRHKLASLLRDLRPQYASPVKDHEHKANIQKIADEMTSEFKNCGLLYEDSFRVGIAQKALNLYLKYLWCLAQLETPNMATPPHCPFDNGIIGTLHDLNEEEKQRLQWTTLDSLGDYQKLVEAGLKEIKATNQRSLSDWELNVWKPKDWELDEWESRSNPLRSVSEVTPAISPLPWRSTSK